ncbi:LysR family transcriptional regulator [Parasedimentitalea marina]|uniref:LysR family transcriptional regulator n=1 Tax=Parasedimentitalea marina TaxID=2483033 RepID=A0A3T0N1Z3_9RHOB|nr:LysR family transcriptional regulator [Parasedimentitalea marina]AZV78043.1 LysR family transcriptional regulator [Parasedimentitalea marina]
MPLNWDDLKILLAVARGGSLSRAAIMLEVDQSTISRRLSGMEVALDTVLFKRSKTGLQASDAGERLLPLAEAVEQAVDVFVEGASDERPGGPSGLVRIFGNAWILNRLSERVLPNFLAQYPNVDVRLLTQAPTSPVRSDATVSLWFEAPPKHGDTALRLGDVPFALYALKGRDPDALDWVSFYDEDAPDRAPVRYWNRHRGDADKLRVTVTDAGLILASVRSGAGKGLLPMCLGEQDTTLQAIDGPKSQLTRSLHLHVHPDTLKVRRVEAVVATLREQFEQVFLP